MNYYNSIIKEILNNCESHEDADHVHKKVMCDISELCTFNSTNPGPYESFYSTLYYLSDAIKLCGDDTLCRYNRHLKDIFQSKNKTESLTFVILTEDQKSIIEQYY